MSNNSWTKVLTGLWHSVASLSISGKILGMVLGITALLGIVVTVEVRTQLTADLGQSLEERGIAITRDLAARSADLILTQNNFALYQLLRDTLENNPDVRYVFILDPRGQVIAHSFPRSVPPDLLQVNRLPDNAFAQPLLLRSQEGSITDIAAPIFEGKAGVVRVGLTHHRLDLAVARATRNLLLITLLTLLAGAVVSYLLTRILTRPILRLVDAVRHVTEGDLSVQTPVIMEDEVGELTVAFNAMTTQLAHTQEELKAKEIVRGQLLQRLIGAQEEERLRIARELHDEAGQALTSMGVGLHLLAEAEDVPPEARRQARELKALSSHTLESLRRLAMELRPPALDRLGLVTALEQYVEEYGRRCGVQADFQAVGLDGRRLASTVEISLYRILQEALTNVARHAAATSIAVLLECREGEVVLIVEDDGQGFDPATPPQNGHLGLHGMRERAETVGGHVTLETSPGAGTTLFVEVPLGR